MTSVESAPGEIRLEATGRVRRRQLISRWSHVVLLAISLLGVAALAVLMVDVLSQGARHLSLDFFTSYASRFPERAGIRAAALGTLWVMTLTLVMVIPIAIGTAVWIEEFAPRNRLLGFVKLNIANLAAVPSIIYGVLGLAVFVRFLGLGPSILAGSLTLFLMILPMTVISAQEAIRQVPVSTRQGSLALGATEWQTVWHHVLPGAFPGMITGLILAAARAAGETAALIMIGAIAFIAFDNTSIFDDFTVMPIQIHSWTTRPQPAFHEIAGGAIIVLMTFVLALNLTAAVLRERFRNR